MQNTFQIESEEELLQAFRLRDRKLVDPPKWLRFPLNVEHYLAWNEPASVYAFLVFKKPDWPAPIGLVFKRSYAGDLASAGRMCDWCHSYGASDEIGLMTVAVNPRRTVGMLLCLDLSCVLKTENVANLAGRNFEKMAQSLCDRIGRFYESNFAPEKAETPS
jgi:hypothetical protein